MPIAPLKSFADALYQAPGAQSLLLECQDQLGLDVLCLLSAGWLGATGRSLDVQSWRHVLAGHLHWRAEVIEPLRRARRALKPMGDAGAVYEQVKQCELSAEWLALRRLERSLTDLAVPDARPIAVAVAEIVDNYCAAEARSKPVPNDMRSALIELLRNGSGLVSRSG